MCFEWKTLDYKLRKFFTPGAEIDRSPSARDSAGDSRPTHTGFVLAGSATETVSLRDAHILPALKDLGRLGVDVTERAAWVLLVVATAHVLQHTGEMEAV